MTEVLFLHGASDRISAAAWQAGQHGTDQEVTVAVPDGENHQPGRGSS